MVTWNNTAVSPGITTTSMPVSRPPLQPGASKSRGPDPRRFVWGLDLGQSADPSAIALLEMTEGPDPNDPDGEPVGHYAVRYLRRWQIGTKYTQVQRDVAELVARPEILAAGGSLLCVDGTGCGRPVVDGLREANLRAEIAPIMIVAGRAVPAIDEAGYWHVPKAELVSVMQLLLQSRRLKVSSRIPDSATLVKELLHFKVRITTSANEQYGEWRQGQHDDLVLSLAIGAWAAENGLAGSLGDTGEPINLGRHKGEAQGWVDRVAGMNPLL